MNKRNNCPNESVRAVIFGKSAVVSVVSEGVGVNEALGNEAGQLFSENGLSDVIVEDGAVGDVAEVQRQAASDVVTAVAGQDSEPLDGHRREEAHEAAQVCRGFVEGAECQMGLVDVVERKNDAVVGAAPEAAPVQRRQDMEGPFGPVRDFVRGHGVGDFHDGSDGADGVLRMAAGRRVNVEAVCVEDSFQSGGSRILACQHAEPQFLGRNLQNVLVLVDEQADFFFERKVEIEVARQCCLTVLNGSLAPMPAVEDEKFAVAVADLDGVAESDVPVFRQLGLAVAAQVGLISPVDGTVPGVNLQEEHVGIRPFDFDGVLEDVLHVLCDCG